MTKNKETKVEKYQSKAEVRSKIPKMYSQIKLTDIAMYFERNKQLPQFSMESINCRYRGLIVNVMSSSMKVVLMMILSDM
jgi:hypothetical protein